jgi:diguanylate cyclase (GGDEF)-like protein/PAS domain S-box-containing protein
MEAPIRIVLAEDVTTDAELEVRQLRRAGLAVDYRVVDTQEAFRAALEDHRPDVILSDFSMPTFDGMAALAIAREQCPDVPFIFVSGTLGEEYAIRALKSGAVDYVLKTNLIRLPAAVERAVAEARSRAARRKAEHDLDTTRERLSSIFANLNDVLYSLDADTRELLYISPAVSEVYGHPAEAFLADRTLRERMIHADDAEDVRMEWSRLVPRGFYDVEYRITRVDGAVRWIHDRARWVPANGKQAARIDGIARDVTEQAQQRRRIARLSQIREVLSAVNNAIVRVRERAELLEETCRIAVDIGGLKMARIGLLDAGTGVVTDVVSRGDDRDAVIHDAFVHANHGQAGDDIVGQSVRLGEVAIHNDIANDPDVRNRDLLLRNGTRSVGSFPLLVDGRPAGAFVLHARDRGYFDHDEVHLLKEVTGNVAFALSLLSKQEQLNYLAYYDALTGLPNRTYFHSQLSETLESARPARDVVGLILFNIARFKNINDTFGHQGGDRLLQQLASRLTSAGDDVKVARLGSDQFAMLLPAARDVSLITRALNERAAVVFDAPFDLEGRELRIFSRAGVAVFPYDGRDADTLFRNAEAAVAKARSSGERFAFYAPELNARVAERLELENKLRRAVERREFVLYYQPKVDLGTGRVVGLEALMRWNDPDSGIVAPGRFIPVLEETGLILEVGRWALQEAMSTFASWRAQGLQPPRIAVNVSAIQLQHPSFVGDFERICGPVPPEERGLDIEITESLLMEDISGAIGKMQALHRLGLEIAIDDFGTGYSSLAYINKLPIHMLKIDRSFVHGMSDDADSTSIVSSIIGLAKGLRLKVIAEGVETEEQKELLKALRCDQVQGFLLGRPMSREAVETLLREAQPRG